MTGQPQEQAREKIPSNTLADRLVELAEGISGGERYYARITTSLSEFVKLRLSFIQHYREYSPTERKEVREMLKLVSELYDDRMQLARVVEYNEIIAGPKKREQN